jgi:acyl-CoA thioesterase II
VLDLLTLEQLEQDLDRGTTVFEESFSLYGGRVAAQALRAAGDTVEPDRTPHSLHGYYLRSGDAARPPVFKVARDRDGRSFSSRRVVAVQGGGVIFCMSASFQAPEPGVDIQMRPAPDKALGS